MLSHIDVARVCRGPAATVLAVFAASCSMSSSTLVDSKAQVGCHSDAGSYFLAKSLLKVKVRELTADDEASKKAGYYIESVKQEVQPDRRYPYCLDYLASSSSNDTFLVKKTADKSLIKKITSSADDQSQQIASTLIDAAFIGISQNPAFNRNLAQATRASFGGPRIASDNLRFEADYDPFNVHQAAVINDSLNDFGFCLVLEDQTFDSRHAGIDDYCDHPLKYSSREAGLTKAGSGGDHYGLPPKAYTDGLFYRPRLPYNYLLFAKTNRQLPGGWKLRGTTTIYLENKAPIFAINIDRTFFAKRETTLDFDDGALRDIKIEKGSELVGVVSIPLQIAQSIAALPANIIQVRINNTNNQGKLIEAQTALIKEKENTLKALETYEKTKATASPEALAAQQRMSTRSSANYEAQANLQNICLANCLESDPTKPRCPRFCACMAPCQANSNGDQTSCKANCENGT
jgi:hypothetical protein